VTPPEVRSVAPAQGGQGDDSAPRIDVHETTFLSLDPEARATQPPPSDPEASGDWRDPYIGTLVDGRYRIERLLGMGGMGLVYLARQRTLERPVAIKIVRAEHAGNREIGERFVTEARAASSAGSPHIVDVLDFGTLPDGATFLAMEYLEGVTLSEFLEARRSLPARLAIELAQQIADGLGDAHARGIIHRDLKPENVFLTRSHGELFVKILDFGIAKVATASVRLTRAGQIFGTPHYMSPEQARGQGVDARTDIYALGVLLYEMVCGQLPFDADNPLVILARHCDTLPLPPSRRSPPVELPEGLEAVILRCLEKSPDARWPSMQELRAELDAVLAGKPNLPPQERTTWVPHLPRSLGPLPLRPTLWRRTVLLRRRWSLAAWAVIALSLLVGWSVEQTRGRERLSLSRGLLRDAPRVARALGHAATRAMAPPRDAEAEGRRVALLLSPLDAEVFQDGQSLGTMPVSVLVPPGQQVQLVVQREGYWSQRVVLDDSANRRLVQLGRIDSTPAPGPLPLVPDALDEPTLLGDATRVLPVLSPPVRDAAATHAAVLDAAGPSDPVAQATPPATPPTPPMPPPTSATPPGVAATSNPATAAAGGAPNAGLTPPPASSPANSPAEGAATKPAPSAPPSIGTLGAAAPEPTPPAP